MAYYDIEDDDFLDLTPHEVGMVDPDDLRNVKGFETELDDLELVEVNDQPQTESWKFPPMTRVGNNGVCYIWQIGFHENQLLILHGPIDTQTVEKRQVDLNTSGRDLQEQALQEARIRYQNKYKSGYIGIGQTEPPMVKGMKGYLYKDGEIKKFPVLVSPKLDGLRLLAQHEGGDNVVCRSYLNSVYTHLGHIVEELIVFFSFIGIVYACLDGELFRRGLELYEIQSIVHTVKTRHPDLEKIRFYIFDLITDEDMPSEIRYQKIKMAYDRYVEETGSKPKYLKIVPNKLIYDVKSLKKEKDRRIKQKYEGICIRRVSYEGYIDSKGREKRSYFPKDSKDYKMCVYKHGRSKRIFKWKDYIDEEGFVVGVRSAKGEETGAAMLLIKDVKGHVIPIRHGKEEDRRKWMKNPKLVIGRVFKFKHVGRGPNGIPIQPTGIGFRDLKWD